MIIEKEGNLLKSGCQVLVNPVNCVGVMGKGLALQFKQAYPEMFTDYQRACTHGELFCGLNLHFWKATEAGPLIVNFPTKTHWRDSSRLEWIDKGLQNLGGTAAIWKWTSMAVPPLGCGLGGLKWEDVYPLIQKYLGSLTCEVWVYVPRRRTP
jgi:O-acetyl-ADP-ribose deacetylase (regulator of RNase III)